MWSVYPFWTIDGTGSQIIKDLEIRPTVFYKFGESSISMVSIIIVIVIVTVVVITMTTTTIIIIVIFVVIITIISLIVTVAAITAAIFLLSALVGCQSSSRPLGHLVES